MHPDFVALAMVMIRLGEGRGGSAERRSQESEGDGNFLHGIFHRCEAGKKVKWLHIAGHSRTGSTDADIGGRAQRHTSTRAFMVDDVADHAFQEVSRRSMVVHLLPC